jgi:hypothetical protein
MHLGLAPTSSWGLITWALSDWANNAFPTLILLVESSALFRACGLLLGVFVGPVQAASRSLLARLASAPLHNTGGRKRERKSDDERFKFVDTAPQEDKL